MAAPAERDGVTDLMHAAWPGRAPLIKGLKLINLWFHMVGCFRFVSPLLFPSHMFSLSLSLSLISTDVPANEATGFFFWPFALISHPWFIHPDRNLLPPPLSVSLWIISSIIFLLPLVLILFHLPFPFFPSSNLPSTSVSISMGSEQQGSGKTRLGHHSTQAFPPYQPHYSSSGP